MFYSLVCACRSGISISPQHVLYCVVVTSSVILRAGFRFFTFPQNPAFLDFSLIGKPRATDLIVRKLLSATNVDLSYLYFFQELVFLLLRMFLGLTGTCMSYISISPPKCILLYICHVTPGVWN